MKLHDTPRHPPRRALTLSAVAFASLLMAAQARAETCTWTGAASGSATLASNWNCSASGAKVPVGGDDLVFPDNAPHAASLSIDFPFSSPTFHDITFGTGYTVVGNALNASGALRVTGSFTNRAIFDGNSTSTLHVLGSPGGPLAYFSNALKNVDSITVGNGTATAYAIVDAIQGGPWMVVTVASQGVLSLGPGTDMNQLIVQPGGTWVVSDVPPYAPANSQVGSAKVRTLIDLQAGSTLQYQALTSHDPGTPELLNGDLNLSGATLKVVVQDPSNPDPVGTVRNVISYGDGGAAIHGTFNGLPDKALVQASNAPGVWYRIDYGNAAGNSTGIVQLTRVAAPVVPPGGPGGPGGTAAIPALAPAALALLSTLVAGVGAVRRRKGKKGL